jgi:hypothetical protein
MNKRVPLAVAGAVLPGSGNRTVPAYNLKNLVNINTMKREEPTMINRLRSTCSPYPSDQMTDSLTNDDPPPKEWHVKSEDYSAARRALYAARMQLG